MSEQISQAVYTATVNNQASPALKAMADDAVALGATIEELDKKVGRGQRSFSQMAAALDPVEKAIQSVERASSRYTDMTERATRAAAVEGVEQQRLTDHLQRLSQARDNSVLATVRSLSTQQQALVLARTGYSQLADQIDRTTVAAQRHNYASQAVGMAQTTAASSNRSYMLGQAGYQVQDFAVQVSGGQSPLVALSQQGAQLLSIFRPGGVVAAAGLTLGVLAVQLASAVSGATAMNAAMERMRENYRTALDEARQYREGLADESRAVRDLTDQFRSMSAARQEMEIESISRDRRAVESRRAALERSVLGNLRGVSVSAQESMADAYRAAAAYPEGSEERSLLMNNSDVQRLRDIASAIESFRESGNVSRDAIGGLWEQLRALSTDSDAVSSAIRRQGSAMVDLMSQARQLEQDTAQVDQRARAAGVGIDTLANSFVQAARQARQLREMLNFEIRVSGDAAREIANLDRLVAAARGGEGSLRRERRAIGVEEQTDRAVADFRRQQEQQGTTGDSAAAEVNRFREAMRGRFQEADQRREELRLLEEGFRSTTRAVQDMRDAYAELRRDAGTGLLSMSPSDDRAFNVISQQVRQTRQAIQQQSFDAQAVGLREQMIGMSAADRAMLQAEAQVRQRNGLLLGAPANDNVQDQIRQARELAQRGIEIDQMQASYTELGRIGEQAFDRIGSAITTAMTQGKMELKDLANIGNAVASELMQAFIRLAVLNPLKNALFGGNDPTLSSVGGVVGRLLGNTGIGGGYDASSYASAFASAAPGMYGPGFHSGGIIGGDTATFMRMVPGNIFAAAPRHHAGLMPDEMPAILQRGEGVFTPAQMAALGPAGHSVSVGINFSGDAGSPQDREALAQLVAQQVSQQLGAAAPGIVKASHAYTMGEISRGGRAAQTVGRRA
ncbi:phage tail length tape measure family protein [Rhodovarius lipocyclicus]|uniref:phage tail length tape measure family protein n=1 Tax=Rhodovarius lipocyclicus TaxID=268410 RepID=UPI001357F690|nr:phage tail length tape measure family protein [Rhodovarius lipocyclicus]